LSAFDAEMFIQQGFMEALIKDALIINFHQRWLKLGQISKIS